MADSTEIYLSEAAKLSYAAPPNEEVQAFAESLDTPFEQLEEGVEWLDLQGGLDADSSLQSKGLITRTHSRGISAAVLARTEEDDLRLSMSFIIGSSGIVKSRTLTFLLRELLKRDTVNVQYFDQKAKRALLFLRRGGMTHAYKGLSAPVIAHGALFDSEDKSAEHVETYILLDPSESGASFAYPSSSHLIVSCSANNNDYLNVHKETCTRQ
eukprot:scaffold10364_cov61-Attheya_sp.AAC.9